MKKLVGKLVKEIVMMKVKMTPRLNPVARDIFNGDVIVSEFMKNN